MPYLLASCHYASLWIDAPYQLRVHRWESGAPLGKNNACIEVPKVYVLARLNTVCTVCSLRLRNAKLTDKPNH